MDAEFVVAGHLGGECALEERHVVVVVVDPVSVVPPVVVVVEIVTAVAGTCLEHALARWAQGDKTTVVGEVEVGGVGRDHEALNRKLIGVLDYGVNITDLGLVRPSRSAFGSVGESPVDGYVYPGRLLGEVDGNAVGVGGVFVWVSGILVGETPLVGEVTLDFLDLVHGQCLVIEENFGDLPVAALIEGGGAVVACSEGHASIGGGHYGAGVVDFILLATIAALETLETVVTHGPEVVAVLLVDVGVASGVVGARGGANRHAHAVVASALAELPALSAVSSLGDDGRPVDACGSPSRHEYGHVLEGVEGVAVVVGEGEVIVLEENDRQIVLVVRYVGGLSVGRTEIGRVGVVALARLVSPEEDAAVVGGKIRHDLARYDAAEVSVASAVDGGYVGLGEDSAVNADVVHILGESLTAVVVVAHGIYGFTGGSRGVALVGSVQVEKGFVCGSVRNDH